MRRIAIIAVTLAGALETLVGYQILKHERKGKDKK